MKSKYLIACGLILGTIAPIFGDVSLFSHFDAKKGHVQLNKNSDKRTEAEKIRDELFKCHVANKFYDLVFVDVAKTRDRSSTKMILDSSSMIVYTMSPNLKQIDTFFSCNQIF